MLFDNLIVFLLSERFDFGFQQPNVAGAFFAMIALSFWVFFLNNRCPIHVRFQWFYFILGAFSVLAMVLTQSRGALFSLIVILGFILCLLIAKRPELSRAYCIKIILLFTTLTSFIFFTNMKDRVSSQELLYGASTTYRLELWEAGLNMIYLKPLFGWGVDQSGEVYMQWFQRLDSNHRVAGMINSFLHIATERGLLVLFIGLLPII